MKNKRLVVVLSVVLLAALTLVGVVAAQDNDPPVPNDPYDECGFAGCFDGDAHMHGYGHGYGHGHGRGWGLQDAEGMGWMHNYMVSAFADALGLSTEAIEEQIESGIHMWDIAAENGMNADDFKQFMYDVREQALEQALADGIIDAQLAEWMLERMEDRHSDEFDFGNGGCPGGRWGGGSGGHWHMRPFYPDSSSG